MEVLSELAQQLGLDATPERGDLGAALIWLVPTESLQLRRNDDGTWWAWWRATVSIGWTCESPSPWAVLGEVLRKRIGWGWGFSPDLRLFRRAAQLAEARAAVHVDLREVAP